MARSKKLTFNWDRPPGVEKIRRLCDEAWRRSEFIRSCAQPPPREAPGVTKVPYEDFMMAQVIRGVPGKVGILNVEFPAGCVEDNHLHCHPADRVIVVTGGCGLFVAMHDGKLGMIWLKEGDVVLMPQGVLHTFASGPDGLWIRTIHNPFIPIDSPECISTPEGASILGFSVADLVSGRHVLPPLNS